MKIDLLKKHYRNFIDGLLNRPGEVFTYREVLRECQKHGIECSKSQVSHYLRDHFGHAKVSPNIYYGIAKNINLAKKAARNASKVAWQ